MSRLDLIYAYQVIPTSGFDPLFEKPKRAFTRAATGKKVGAGSLLCFSTYGLLNNEYSFITPFIPQVTSPRNYHSRGHCKEPC